MPFNYSLARALRLLSVALALLLATGYTYAHSGPLNKVAVKACTDKIKSQDCQYEGAHSDLYIGTCQHMARDMMCVRNQAIRKIEAEKEGAEDGQHHQHEALTK